jgi:hypothetical protein
MRPNLLAIDLDFRVRWYQRGFHEALVNRTHDRLMAIWHRRAGKDEIALNAVADLSDREVGTYWHCFPEYKQARKAIWNGVNPKTGKRRIYDHFHPSEIERMQDDDMFIEKKNGSTYQLLGSDRYDATVGSGPRGIVYSEWALSNPSAWAYHSPMIREAGGWAAFITTPRGNNHAKTMFDRAKSNPNWFADLLTIKDTRALTAEVLAEALQEYQDLHGIEMGQAFFDQEYLCSFAGAIVGAYFGAEINSAERQRRIRVVPIDWDYPVHTVMDLGKAVNNPMWFFQVIAGQPRIVDFYRPETDDLDDWLRWIDDRGYVGHTYVPHDIMVTEWGSKRTRFDILCSKRKNVERITKVSVADGLQAGRMTINEAVFHSGDDDRGQRMELGVEGLRNYRREWDEDLKTFRENPVKDWAEHIGSAWRYLGLSWRAVRPPVVKEEKPKELEYRATSSGRIEANMSVKEAVDAMVRRRRMRDG